MIDQRELSQSLRWLQGKSSARFCYVWKTECRLCCAILSSQSREILWLFGRKIISRKFYLILFQC